MTWRDTAFARDLGLALPIIQAPMAGGISSPRLAAAVSAAGGLGCLAGAMLDPTGLREAIHEVRALTDAPFAVNLFAPLPPPSPDGVEEWADLTGVTVRAVPAPPRFEDQITVVIDERVPVFSFTFGIPPLAGVEAVTVGTATTVAEAVALERAGVTAVVAQGYEAGGHRGSFLEPAGLIATLALVPQIVDAVSIPVIAAGAIMDGRGIAAARCLGAQAVQLGTAFMCCPEAGTSPAHRAALTRETTITSVLTGRAARAVRTEWVDRLEAAGRRPPDYPLPRFLAPEPPMLAGQGGPMARSMPAAELVAVLAAETDRELSRLT
jgi:nitronate monooxygenase